MFKADLCKVCGKCLTECQWMDVDREQAIVWQKQMIAGKESPALKKCITCQSCNEVCPQKANPYDLHIELQEKYHSLVSEELISATEMHYRFDGEPENIPQAKRVMSACTYGKVEAQLIQGRLYDLPQVSGKPYFCWGLFSHMGAKNIQQKHAQKFVDRLAATGAEEIVCFHVDCYSMLTNLIPGFGIEIPFRPIHLAEHIVDHLSKHQNDIKPLNMNIAYQRPCASKYTPEMEPVIDQLFALSGATRVERQYDREKALCCSSVKLLYNMDGIATDVEKNVSDAKQAGARAMVYFCPVCRDMLANEAHKQNMPLIFLGDVARMALGEIETPL